MVLIECLLYVVHLVSPPLQVPVLVIRVVLGRGRLVMLLLLLFLFRLKVRLPVCPLSVIGLEVQPGVVPGGGVAVEIVLGETVLLGEPLLVSRRLDLGDGDVLLPMVGPIKLSLYTYNHRYCREYQMRNNETFITCAG